ncbi:MAG TPA: DUF4430 domain-containing protein [Oscillospiraceae bacterium]|nr:DUF4430 domain-containing protein [Oscillospiraceae bacterium]HPS34003.1 DUF4430 domain-containing protein [Oscillospiraceae bacterium]
MKSKSFAVIGCCLLILAVLSGPAAVSAQNIGNTAGEVQYLVGGIAEYNEAQSGVNSIQEWIDTGLTENAGVTSEWYAMALSQSGESYDFSAYGNALKTYLSKNEITDAATRQKYALALISTGFSNDAFVNSAVEDSIGQQGIMSWIFGLHLLNNGCKSSGYTIDAVINQIISLQFTDGGWALYGENSDVDVTAMAIEALSPYYQTDEAVKAAVDKAIVLLSDKQLDDGGYMGFGEENPDSAAQVIVALSSLGIDCTAGSRFIKNDHTLLDAIAQYRLSDSSFSHTKGGDFNHTSTVQIFYALIAFQRQQKGLGPFFVFDKPTTAENQGQTDGAKSGYKFWVSISAAGLALLVSVVLIFKKKTHFKNFLAVVLAAAAVIAFIQLTDFSAASSYYNGKDTEKDTIIGKVTLTIRCDTIVGKSDSKYIPSDGVILKTTSFDIADGETVYDVLVEAARKYNIQVENNGTKNLAYVAGINYLYEYQFGDLSGWVFHVNGTAPSVGCGEYKLSDGDAIEWLYTLEMGDDLQL